MLIYKAKTQKELKGENCRNFYCWCWCL